MLHASLCGGTVNYGWKCQQNQHGPNQLIQTLRASGIAESCVYAVKCFTQLLSMTHRDA